jgi:hypothetical protein
MLELRFGLRSEGYFDTFPREPLSLLRQLIRAQDIGLGAYSRG